MCTDGFFAPINYVMYEREVKKLRNNNMSSEKYIEILRKHNISPEDQIWSIYELCVDNEEMSKKIQKVLSVSRKHRTWREFVAGDYIPYLLDKTYLGAWRDLHFSADVVKEEMFSLFRKIFDEHEYCEIDNNRQYAPKSCEFYPCESTDEQIEEAGQSILSNMNLESMDEYEKSLLLEEQGVNAFQPKESDYDSSNVSESLLSMKECELDSFWNRMYQLSTLVSEDCAKEFFDATWCIREIYHFDYRMRNRKIKRLKTAFESSKT